MKKKYKIEIEEPLDFEILGLCSHAKLYKLCWEINRELKTNFEKTKNHITKTNNILGFERYRHSSEDSSTILNIISNMSKNGYLEPNNKKVNYFFLIQGGIYDKKEIMESLSKIEEVLLVFEVNLSKIKSITPFIIYD